PTAAGAACCRRSESPQSRLERRRPYLSRWTSAIKGARHLSGSYCHPERSEGSFASLRMTERAPLDLPARGRSGFASAKAGWRAPPSMMWMEKLLELQSSQSRLEPQDGVLGFALRQKDEIVDELAEALAGLQRRHEVGNVRRVLHVLDGEAV